MFGCERVAVLTVVKVKVNNPGFGDLLAFTLALYGGWRTAMAYGSDDCLFRFGRDDVSS